MPNHKLSVAKRVPKILVITRTFFPKEGGIEEYVYNRCLQDPDQVIVLSIARPGDQAFDAAQPFPVHRWPDLPLPDGGVKSLLLQIWNMVWSLIYALRLYFQYRYDSIEWAHGYDFPSILALSYLLPIQFFIYLHGNDVLCPASNLVLRSLFGWTLDRAASVVCNSNFTADFVREKFRFRSPIHVINPSVRPSKFGLTQPTVELPRLRSQIRQAYHIPESATVILSVGRLVKRKGFDRLIQNLPGLLQAGQDVHCLICGRGPLEQHLRSLSVSLGVADRVHFAGYVPDRELAGYYAACDLFAMLTFFDDRGGSIEGFGIVYVEASYFGKPVVASRIGGVVDAVKHGETGLLVEPNSSDAIADALLRLCREPELRERLGQRGREWANHIVPHRSLYPVIANPASPHSQPSSLPSGEGAGG